MVMQSKLVRHEKCNQVVGFCCVTPIRYLGQLQPSLPHPPLVLDSHHSPYPSQIHLRFASNPSAPLLHVISLSLSLSLSLQFIEPHSFLFILQRVTLRNLQKWHQRILKIKTRVLPEFHLRSVSSLIFLSQVNTLSLFPDP
jgi:hypothetical protein